MRSPILLVLVAIAAWSGCADQQTTESVPQYEPFAQKPTESVLLPGVGGNTLVLSNPGIVSGRYEVDVVMLGGASPDRSTFAAVPLYAASNPDTIDGIGVQMTDASGRLLWWMSWRAAAEGVVEICERTEQDSLTVLHEPLADGRLRETYVMNGVSRVFEFDPEGLTKADSLAWAAFWPQGTTLDRNRYGHAASRISTSPAVGRWLKAYAEVQSKGEAIGAPMRPGLRGIICSAYRTCATLKCTFGGGPAANPLCAHCLIGVVVCFLIDLVCFFFGAC